MGKHISPAALFVTAILAIGGCTSTPAPGPVTTVTVRPPAASPSPAGSTGTGSTPVTTPAPAPPPAAPAAAFKVCTVPVIACAGLMRTEPSGVQLTGDGSIFVSGITWSGWGSATAVGAGTLNVNNCTPTCAAGTFTTYPATVTLTSLTPYGQNLQAYADMAVSAPTHSFNESFTGLVP